MRKIKIVKSPNADSRSAKEPLTIPALRASTVSHMKDVSNALELFRSELAARAQTHDHTKTENMEEFYNALTSGNVKQSNWYKKHITEERHHLKSHVPEDVNLIDVIEHLVDCTMAGLARSGDIYDTDLSSDVLRLACENTVKLLKNNTVVMDNDDIKNMPIK